MIPTIWRQFYSSPLTFSAKQLYWLLTRANSGFEFGEKLEDSVRLVCISDTHNSQDIIPDLPDGDILVHAGDLTEFGTYTEADAALAWLHAQPHPIKIIIGGNHDLVFTEPKRRDRLLAKYPGIIFLHDASTHVTVRGRVLHVYGHAQVPRSWFPAFQYPRVPPAEAAAGATRLWGGVPDALDVLITHGPPAYHLDPGSDHDGNGGGGPQGCASLLHVLWRVRPRLHVFGHIHRGRGVERVRWTPTQAAYERVCAGLGAWRDVFALARECARTLLWGPAPMAVDVKETILANVASQLEWMDGVARAATVIDI